MDLQTGDLEVVGRPPAAASLRITAEGTLVGIVLFFGADLDQEIRLTTSPFAPLTHWGWDVRIFSRRLPVRPGDQVPLAVEIESTFGNQRMNIDLGSLGWMEEGGGMHGSCVTDRGNRGGSYHEKRRSKSQDSESSIPLRLAAARRFRRPRVAAGADQVASGVLDLRLLEPGPR